MRSIVTPGEQVSEKATKMRNARTVEGRTYSTVLGLMDKEKREIIPLEGVWSPRIDDSVVGIITGEKGKVYFVDLSYFGKVLLVQGKYDKYEFEIGDVIDAVISDIESKNTIVVKDPRQLKGGTIISIKPRKIPRIIGKKSTMIKQVSEATKCRIIVGMNGLIWLNGGNVPLAIETLLKIEREAHTSGLTETIKRFLEERK